MADDRILTTHAGSLPRPSDMVDVLRGQQPHTADETFADRVRQAVADVVARQLEVGLDIVSDGEMGKPNFQMYIEDRLSGFEHLLDADERNALRHARDDTPVLRDLVDFPELARRLFPPEAGASSLGAVCTGPIASATREHVEREVDALRAALAGATERGFISAVSPGQVGFAHADRFYGSRAEYLEGIARAMRVEYEAITEAGFTVQLDSPDLAMAGHMLGPSVWREHLELSVDAVNIALDGIPARQSRLHLCWGNYGGPHHLDMPLADILPTVLRANVGALYVEGANGRHEHEWQAFKEVTLPDHMSVVLGVIDVKTNVVEHPRLVADRLKRLADVIGRERVIAGTDCGFATYAGWSAVDPDVAWLKLRALVEGAAVASDELWS